MHKTNIHKIKNDSIIAENIYTADGLFLISKGSKLNSQLLKRLEEYGFLKVAIEDERFKGILFEKNELLNEKTKQRALSVTKDILENYKISKKIGDVSALNDVAQNIIDDILSNTTIGLDINEIQGYDNNTYTHSLSVTILSLYIAKKMQLKRGQLIEIGIGGLLHDVGKLNIPIEILNKPGKLTTEEFDIVKKHPMDGFNQLKDKISLLSAHIALQHHEKFNGTGYPRNLKGLKIHEYGRICAVADVFDALTANRPYRSGMKTDRAIQILLESSESHFDPDILAYFLEIVTVYPNGSIVILNNGDKAFVLNQNSDFPFQPNVLIFEKNKNLLKDFQSVDLKNEENLQIKEICED